MRDIQLQWTVFTYNIHYTYQSVSEIITVLSFKSACPPVSCGHVIKTI